MSKAVIVSAVRTAIGSFGGALVDQPVTELGRLVIESAIERAGKTRPTSAHGNANVIG